MRILITGATGFIGRHLSEALNRDHDIFILTRETTDSSEIDISQKIVFSGDIESLTDYFRQNNIDGIIHLATKYVAEHKTDQIKDIILSNIYLGTAVLEAACNAGVKWFINAGTIWQNYNVPDYSDIYCPVNLYAASKQAFITISKYYTEISPIKFTTLKLCDTYGPNDSRKKIVDLFSRIAKTGETLVMSPGEQLIDIVHIDKVIREFEKLIALLSDSRRIYRAEYVVTSGRHISLRDLAKEFEIEHNVHLNIKWGGRPYRDREVMKPYIGNRIIDLVD